MHPRVKPVVAILLLIACLTLAFAGRHSALHGGYFEDDYAFLALGPLTPAKLIHVTSPVFMPFFYRPVFLLWMLALNSLFPHNPVAMHAAGIVLFGLAVYGVGVLAWRLTGSLIAGIAAAFLFVFGLDFDEAVTWISASSALLGGVFSLAALLAWLGWRESGKRYLYALALAATILAMCSKEDAASLPAILIVFDLYLSWRSGARRLTVDAILPWLPLCAWTIGFLALDLAAYRHLNAVSHDSRVTGIYHGIHLSNLMMLGSLAYRSIVSGPFGNLAPVNVGYVVLFAAFMAALLAGARQFPLAWCLAAMAFLACLPVPLATGAHAMSGRFFYLPSLYGSLFAGVLIDYLLRSDRPIQMQLGAVLAWSAASERLPIPIDMFDSWIALFAICVGALVLWRAIPTMAFTCALALLVSAALFAGQLLGETGAVLAGAIFLGAAYGWVISRTPVSGALIGAALLAGQPLSVAVLLGAAAFGQRRLRRAPATPAPERADPDPAAVQ